MSLLPVGISSSGGYEINNSVRFRSSASAYLSRTPGSASNRKTWTWSGWVKRGALGGFPSIFGAGDAADSGDFTRIAFVSDALWVDQALNGVNQHRYVTSALFRDPSAHYHIVVAYDTPQATASNRIKIYVNGQQITSFSTSTAPAQNADTYVNATNPHQIANRPLVSDYFDGYLSEVNFIDGQALDPTSFGETDAVTGVWVPKRYTGTYGTNGFYLKFNDGSNLTNLCLDRSGNGNNWTATNVSLTAGATYDWMTDTPTNNYCVLNPVNAAAYGTSVTISEANLKAAPGTTYILAVGTIPVSTGKWYWEFSNFTGTYPNLGVTDAAFPTQSFDTASTWQYGGSNGNKINNNVSSSYGATFGGADVIGVALDCDAGTLVFYKNNVSQGTAYSSGLTGKALVPSFTSGFSTGISGVANFGQRPFAYTPPTGFQALCTKNLSTPTIIDPRKHFDVALWLGDNASPRSITGVGFQPGLVWPKARSVAYSHSVFDEVRGAGKRLITNATNAENTNDVSGYVSAFTADGFTMTAGSTDIANVNESTRTYAAWLLKANGAGVSNTAGSITSTVSANTTAGFSIVTYTGTGTSTGDSFGHGLGVQPKMVIIKNRTTAGTGWNVLFPDFMTAGQYMALNLTSGITNSANSGWGGSIPDSTRVYVGGSAWTNTNGNTYVAYCFAEVPGFSKIGSYTGNGSADGPFVFCGFRPRWVMIKCSSTTGNWALLDASRSGYNVDNDPLYANLSNAEATTDLLDITSNGFKLRSTNADVNAAQTYVFLAFAETPFKYSNGR